MEAMKAGEEITQQEIRVFARKNRYKYNTVEKWVRPEGQQHIIVCNNDKKLNKKSKTISVKQGYFPKIEIAIVKELHLAKTEEQGKSKCLIYLLTLFCFFNNILIAIIAQTWISERAKELNKKLKYQKAKFSVGWAARMMKRNGIVLRAVQNIRKDGIATAIPLVYIYFFLH